MNLHDILASHAKTQLRATPKVTYEHRECFVCHGSGLHCWTFHNSEIQEPCRPCCGKGYVVVERFEYKAER